MPYFCWVEGKKLDSQGRGIYGCVEFVRDYLWRVYKANVPFFSTAQEFYRFYTTGKFIKPIFDVEEYKPGVEIRAGDVMYWEPSDPLDDPYRDYAGGMLRVSTMYVSPSGRWYKHKPSGAYSCICLYQDGNDWKGVRHSAVSLKGLTHLFHVRLEALEFDADKISSS